MLNFTPPASVRLAQRRLLQLVWTTLPGDLAPPGDAADVEYVVQRWRSGAMPEPGERDWQESLLPLTKPLAGADDTFTTLDADAPAFSSSFYRIVALAPSGAVLAATRPAEAVVEQGKSGGCYRGCGHCSAPAQPGWAVSLQFKQTPAPTCA